MSDAMQVPDSTLVRRELGLDDPGAVSIEGALNPELDKKAGAFVDALLQFNPNDPVLGGDKLQHIASVEHLGEKSQRNAAHRSSMLKEPIRKLSARGDDGGDVANSLVDLKLQVEALDPGKFDFEAGWFTRTLGFLPGIGSPLKRYFSKYETSQTVIEAIIRSLEEGKKILQRDNITLAQDQNAMRNLTLKLQDAVRLGMLIDQKIAYVLEREISLDDPRRHFLEDEILFPLRQRIQDLQQQLAVNQQAVLAIEILIRNNKELLNGVNRSINVTVNALNVGVTVALALANQKIVLNKIDAVNQTTNRLIADTAARLRTQGAEIHRRASSTQVDIDTLKQAFADIHAALDDISIFRQTALPQMADNILEMDRLTREAEASVQKLEQGGHAAAIIELEVE